jgi:hypothetical protein
VLFNDQAEGLEAMLRSVPSLIRGVPKPIRRILGAFTGAFTTPQFIFDRETSERSVFAVFAYQQSLCSCAGFYPYRPHTPSPTQGVLRIGNATVNVSLSARNERTRYFEPVPSSDLGPAKRPPENRGRGKQSTMVCELVNGDVLESLKGAWGGPSGERGVSAPLLPDMKLR